MIKEFINYLQNLKGYSENTAKGYEKDLKRFVHWMRSSSTSARWSTITRDDIDNYISQQAAQGLKPATTNRRLAAISGLYDYMKRQGYEVENPCKYESRRKIGKNIPNTINEEELAAAYNAATGVTKTMIGLLATTGIRIQELLDLTWEDINFQDGSLKISGKGSKQRIVYTTTGTLADLANVKANCSPTGRMFWFDQRTARYMIYQALRGHCNARQLSPHAIRHTTATHLAKEGVNCTTISAILGHEHLETTQKYINMAQAASSQACQIYSLIN